MTTFCSLPLDLLLRGDVEDPVRVDVERDLDLGRPARRRRDAVEDEPAEALVLRCQRPLALEDVDLDLALVVLRGREDLALAGRDRRVARDQDGHDAALRLDAERQRGHVQEQHVLDVALQDAGLDGRSGGNHLIGVDALVRLLAVEQLFHQVLDGRHAGLAADEHDLVDVGRRDLRVPDGLLDRFARPLDERSR